MSYLDDYINYLIGEDNSDLAFSVKKTADDLGKKYLDSFSYLNHEIGLLFGDIQSGKTSHCFGIISKATDLGFPVFLILTTNNVILHQQMYSRVKKDLNNFCVCDERDSRLFIDNSLVKPTIVVLKKNSRILRYWSNIFKNTGFMRGNPLFIVDDEADESSLNTLINTDDQSTINKYLELIKKEASSSIYLQVTGTPQALLLQTNHSGWHPDFVYYFNPGENYLGGEFFFPKKWNSDNIIFIDDLEDPIQSVVIRHLIVSAYLFLNKVEVSNCLVHLSVLQKDHEKSAEDFKKELNECKNNLRDFEYLFKIEYENLFSSRFDELPFDYIFTKVKEILSSDILKILIINGKHHVDNEKFFSGCNFIIGGNSLSRGVTLPSLNTIYYSRISKNPQADTMWQHSRMFGYDRDSGLIRIYIDKLLYKLFLDINSTNNSIISQVKNNLNSIKIFYPKGISPTRKNVLENQHVELISGGTNYFPSNPDNNTFEDISQLVSSFNDSEKYYQVSLHLIKEILAHIIPSDDFNLNAFLSIIDSVILNNSIQQSILIVRRDRNVTQGTGALISSNDWELINSFNDKIVLALYQINGNLGWKKNNIWVPNIKLPDGFIYYNINND